jgi:dihydrofolate reductase
MGYPILMGRKTHEAIGRPLPGRRNLVMTRNAGWAHAGCERVDSLDAARAMCKDSAELFVIGGAQLYASALPQADRLLITEVDTDGQADVFFPQPDPALWERITLEPAVSRTGLPYAIGTWVRRPRVSAPA